MNSDFTNMSNKLSLQNMRVAGYQSIIYRLTRVFNYVTVSLLLSITTIGIIFMYILPLDYNHILTFIFLAVFGIIDVYILYTLWSIRREFRIKLKNASSDLEQLVLDGSKVLDQGNTDISEIKTLVSDLEIAKEHLKAN